MANDAATTSANLFSRFAAAFAHGGPFLVPPGGVEIDYADVDELTGSICTVLADAGVARGDRVVAQVEKSPAAVLLYLACLRHGAVFVPLNPRFTPAEVGWFIKDADPRLVVHDPSHAPPAWRGAVATLDRTGNGSLMRAAHSALPTAGSAIVAPDDVAVVLYTSGTTGRAKGAMLSHRNLQANAEALHHAWRWQSGDVLLHALPIFHAHGLFVALHCALLSGSPVRLLPRFDADAVVDGLVGSSVFMGVPTYYTRLLEHPGFTRAACRSIRLFTSGSAPLSIPTWTAVRDRTGHEILERYGMSEAGMITSNPYDGPRVPGTVGSALEGLDVRIVDARGDPVATGDMGVLEVRGPSVFSGYWRNPEASAIALRPDGFLVSGDIASMDTTGRVTISGREKDLIITGGENVYPGEVEAAIDAADGVAESAVIGLPDADLGERVAAVVAGSAGWTLDRAALRAAVSDLAHYKHPRTWIVVDALPRNTMGKVEKHTLRARFADAATRQGPLVDARFLS